MSQLQKNRYIVVYILFGAIVFGGILNMINPKPLCSYDVEKIKNGMNYMDLRCSGIKADNKDMCNNKLNCFVIKRIQNLDIYYPNDNLYNSLKSYYDGLKYKICSNGLKMPVSRYHFESADIHKTLYMPLLSVDLKNGVIDIPILDMYNHDGDYSYSELLKFLYNLNQHLDVVDNSNAYNMELPYDIPKYNMSEKKGKDTTMVERVFSRKDFSYEYVHLLSYLVHLSSIFYLNRKDNNVSYEEYICMHLIIRMLCRMTIT